MYPKTSISKLSHNQILRLLRGHRVRVKHGSGHEIHLSEEQHKKLMKAHKKGAGHTIQFDPYQIEEHQHLRHHHKHHHKGHGEALFPAGYGEGIHHHKHHHAGHGDGEGIHHHHKHHHLGHGDGEGIKRKRGRPRKGHGMVANVAKSAAKALAPILIDEGGKYLKKRVAGSSVRKNPNFKHALRTSLHLRRRPKRKASGIGKKILKGIEEYGPLAAEVGLAML